MFKKVMIVCAAIGGGLTVVFGAMYAAFPRSWTLALVITAGTFFYHFAMRLLVGTVWIPFQNHDPNAAWFREKPFERTLYKRLGLKRWKHRVPTYDPATFDMQQHSLEDIAKAMCHSELVHETIVVLSFLPLLAAIPFGEFAIFFITSLLAATFDMTFVILQRYNRPRVLTLIKRQQKSI